MYIAGKTEQASKLLSDLDLINLTDAEIQAWAQGATDLPTMQLRIEQIGKELRDVEKVVAQIVNKLSE
jgi:hypothetical protein